MSTSMNPFHTTDPWEVQTETIFGPGNYVVTIQDAQGGTSSGGHPQIELKLVNDQGAIRDWLVITDAAIGKVVALCNATGLPLPEDDDLEPGEHLRLKQVYIDRLVGLKTGVVVRDEPDYKDPTRMRSRVQGYVDPSRIDVGSDATPQGSAASFSHPQPKPNEDLPF